MAIDSFNVELIDDELENSTINRYLSALQELLGHAIHVIEGVRKD